jgi:hypothetical protein
MRIYKSAVFTLVAFTLAELPAWAQEAKTVEVILPPPGDPSTRKQKPQRKKAASRQRKRP